MRETGYQLPPYLFVQYLNPELTNLYGVSHAFRAEKIYNHAERLTRYAVLFANEGIVFPHSYLGEVPVLDQLLKHLAPVRAAGLVFGAGPTASIGEYFQEKRTEYRDEPGLFPNYFSPQSKYAHIDGLLWYPRFKRSASRYIKQAWKEGLVSPKGHWQHILENNPAVRNKLPSQLESAISQAPTKLNGRAFIYRYVEPHLPFVLQSGEKAATETIISKAYLQSYLDECEAFLLIDTPLGKLDCDLPSHNARGELQLLSWRRIGDFFDALELRQIIESNLSWIDILALRAIPNFKHLVQALVRDNVLRVPQLLNALIDKGCLDTLPSLRASSSPYHAVVDRLCRVDEATERFHPQLWDNLMSHEFEIAQRGNERTKIMQVKSTQLETPIKDRNHVDLAVIIALKEEFRIFMRSINEMKSFPHPKGKSHFRFTKETQSGVVVNCVAAMVGQLSSSKAAIVTERVYDEWKPSTIVNIGIAGSLDSEVLLGHVVAASVVDMYLERAKVVPSVNVDELDWKLSGEPYRSTQFLLDAADEFEFEHPDRFKSWCENCKLRISESDVKTRRCLDESGGIDGPQIHVGHIASGPAVGAAESFKQFLRNKDRCYLALEMESGGVLMALNDVRNVVNILAIKGISDPADERKESMDLSTKGEIRQIAMLAATNFLWAMVDAGIMLKTRGDDNEY